MSDTQRYDQGKKRSSDHSMEIYTEPPKLLIGHGKPMYLKEMGEPMTDNDVQI